MAIAMKKTAAIAIAAGLTFAGSAGIAAQDALAQDGAEAPAVVAPALAEKAPAASTIKNESTYKLTINKRVNPTELVNSNGEAFADADKYSEPLNGATFQIEKLDGDITKQAVYNDLVEKANKYNKSHAQGDLPDLDKDFKKQDKKTEGQGQAVFENLAPGAYLVTETATPEIKGKQTYVGAQPFIVFVPMTNSKGDGWNANVQVYPKNSMARVTKEVQDDNVHAEDEKRAEANSTVKYILEGVVPSAPEGKVLKNLTLTDASKSDELKWDFENDNLIEKVERVYKDAQGQEKTAPITNFRVVKEAPVPNADNVAAGADQAFRVIVDDPAGEGLKANEKLRVTVKATLLQGNDQQIENSVNEHFFFRNPGEDVGEGDEPDGETPHDKVISYIGNINVVKVDKDNKEEKLAGAKFQLYRCDVPGTIIQEGVTSDQGELSFTGIHVTDWVDGDEAKPAKKNFEYCLKETEAPKGYILPEGEKAVTKLTLTREDIVETDGVKVRQVSKDIENIPDTKVPLLPATGGMGVLIIALAGLAIIGGGVYAARRNSRSA
ncbi:hypothetical protein HMPREF3171_01260 [Corynebacterium sp. HMSC08F01]|uniref:SpaH/EbpB family LPXTG-anchored major pilin n=1 Tax=Corynebacterium sp. HMSC08F01 TaxID=1581139 RepID=UPI0008A20FD9|nr:SpaH/EbpB family LPXTG-anchored major pilin [Corynebacterium sp. HMSC08F01]OFT31824.1 hypothetical protein HMPREF3171_01260 [Corynebacterium sp. HMSC08F01]